MSNQENWADHNIQNSRPGAYPQFIPQPQQNPQYAPQQSPQYAPQQNPQYAPQQNPQYAPQQNPQYAPQQNPQYAPQQHNPQFAPSTRQNQQFSPYPQEPNRGMNPAQRQVNETAAKKNGKSPALIALLCVLCGCLVVLVGVCIYFFLNDDDASEKNQTKDKETKTSAVAYSTESTEAIIETFIQSAPVETEYEPEVTEAVQKETLNLHLTYDYIDFDVPASGYVFEDSSNRLIKESELYALTEHQCCIARNEIFARHGRKFADKRISEYFNALPWYTGRIDGSVFDANIDSYLSATEKKNIETIRAYELRVYGG